MRTGPKNLITDVAGVKRAVVQIEATDTFVDPEFGAVEGARTLLGWVLDRTPAATSDGVRNEAAMHPSLTWRGIAQLAQALQVYLKGMRRGRQSLHRRIEVADGAFVHIGPIEQDEIPIAVDKDRNGLEQRLVEVVVHGAPSRKGDLPFPRGPAEEDADLNEVVGHALLFHW